MPAVVVVLSATAGLTAPPSGPDPPQPDQRALARILDPPLGLPAVPASDGNPPSAAKIRLGRKLFLDRRLSINGTLSCAMCHVPEQGFTVNELRTSVGHRGKTLRRNAPTLLNVAFAGPWFHDGREPELDLQPFDVFLNPDEMASPSLGAILHKVKSLPDYEGLFPEAFGGPPSVAGIGQAIGTYLRTLLSANSPFDRWRFAGEAGALGESAKRGFRLFVGEAGCSRCHIVGDDDALFTDHSYHDTGVGWYDSAVGPSIDEPVAVEIAPGVVTRLDRGVVASVGEPRGGDLGRYEVTGETADRWRFKTPSLRNVALTPPYMHNGVHSTLRQVIEFYDAGAYPHEGLDPLLKPLRLDDRSIDDLVSFLESLTGDNIEELVRDARSQPVGNP